MNSRPFAYEATALPLSYTGCDLIIVNKILLLKRSVKLILMIILDEIKIVRVAAVDLYYHHLLRRNIHHHKRPHRLAKTVISHFWRFLCSCGLYPTFLALDCRAQPCCLDADSSNPTELAILQPPPAPSVFCSVERCSRPT